jgi:hypothetical protein
MHFMAEAAKVVGNVAADGTSKATNEDMAKFQRGWGRKSRTHFPVFHNTPAPNISRIFWQRISSCGTFVPQPPRGVIVVYTESGTTAVREGRRAGHRLWITPSLTAFRCARFQPLRVNSTRNAIDPHPSCVVMDRPPLIQLRIVRVVPPILPSTPPSSCLRVAAVGTHPKAGRSFLAAGSNRKG